MKKMILMMSLAMAFLFTGCIKNENLKVAKCKEIDGSKCLTNKEVLSVVECKNPITINKRVYCKGDK
jgi:hypothetical protein